MGGRANANLVLQGRFFSGRFGGSIVTQPPPALVGVTAGFGTVTVTAAGTTAATFTVQKSADLLLTPVTVGWAVAGSGVNPLTASYFLGGVVPSGTISLPAGTPSATVTITFAAIAPPATALTGSLSLNSPTGGAAIDPAAAGFACGVNSVGTNGAASVSQSFAAVAISAGGTTTASFTIVKSADLLNASVSVPWSVAGSGGTPVVGADFQGGTLPSGTATIGVGTAGATVTLTFAAASPPATAHAGLVALGTPTGASLGTPSSFSFQITSSAVTGTASISASFASATVSLAGTTTQTFVIAKSASLLASSVTVPWAVTATGLNPVSGADFAGGVLPTGSVTIPAATASSTVTLTFAAEAAPAAARTGQVALGTPAGATLGTPSSFTFQVNAAPVLGTVSITNSFSTATVNQAATTTATFTVSKTSNILGSSVTVPWAVTGTGGSPALGSDFVGGTLPTGNLVIGVGVLSATVTLSFAAEAPPAAAETGLVTLSAPSAGPATLGTPSSFGFVIPAGVIAPPGTHVGVAASFASVTVDPLNQVVANVSVGKTGITNVACTVDWAVTPDPSAANQISAADFGGVLPSGTLSIGAALTSKQIALTFAAENPPASDRGGLFTLSNPQPAATVDINAANASFSFVIARRVVAGTGALSAWPLAAALLANGNANRTNVSTKAGLIYTAAAGKQRVVTGNIDLGGGSVTIDGGTLGQTTYLRGNVDSSDPTTWPIISNGFIKPSANSLVICQLQLRNIQIVPQDGGKKLQIERIWFSDLYFPGEAQASAENGCVLVDDPVHLDGLLMAYCQYRASSPATDCNGAFLRYHGAFKAGGVAVDGLGQGPARFTNVMLYRNHIHKMAPGGTNGGSLGNKIIMTGDNEAANCKDMNMDVMENLVTAHGNFGNFHENKFAGIRWTRNVLEVGTPTAPFASYTHFDGTLQLRNRHGRVTHNTGLAIGVGVGTIATGNLWVWRAGYTRAMEINTRDGYGYYCENWGVTLADGVQPTVGTPPNGKLEIWIQRGNTDWTGYPENESTTFSSGPSTGKARVAANRAVVSVGGDKEGSSPPNEHDASGNRIADVTGGRVDRNFSLQKDRTFPGTNDYSTPIPGVSYNNVPFRWRTPENGWPGVWDVGPKAYDASQYGPAA